MSSLYPIDSRTPLKLRLTPPPLAISTPRNKIAVSTKKSAGVRPHTASIAPTPLFISPTDGRVVRKLPTPPTSAPASTSSSRQSSPLSVSSRPLPSTPTFRVDISPKGSNSSHKAMLPISEYSSSSDSGSSDDEGERYPLSSPRSRVLRPSSSPNALRTMPRPTQRIGFRKSEQTLRATAPTSSGRRFDNEELEWASVQKHHPSVSSSKKYPGPSNIIHDISRKVLAADYDSSSEDEHDEPMRAKVMAATAGHRAVARLTKDDWNKKIFREQHGQRVSVKDASDYAHLLRSLRSL